MPSETGKTDMERIGLFSEMEYITIGDKYVSQFNRPFNEAASKNKQMLPGGNKEKAATQAGYFDPVFGRIFEGESYINPVQLRRRYRMAEAKKNLGSKTFLPSNGDKFPCGVGTYYGTIGGPCPYFSAQTKDRPPYVQPGKNLYTSPGKKGTGYGYPNLTIGKPYPHSVELYDIGKINMKKTSEEHHRLMKGGPFKLNLYPREYFDMNPYHDDKPLPPPKKQPTLKPIQQPFKPSSPGKKDASRVQMYHLEGALGPNVRQTLTLEVTPNQVIVKPSHEAAASPSHSPEEKTRAFGLTHCLNMASCGVVDIGDLGPYIALSLPFQPGGMKAGTFDPYPSHSTEPYIIKVPKPVTTNKQGQVFHPNPGTKSRPVRSIMTSNIEKSLNVTNYTNPRVMSY